MSEKNQYGRKTWDVDEYARVAKERKRTGNGRRIDDEFIKKNLNNGISNDEILAFNIRSNNNNEQQETIFGEDNSWFVCRICNRRYKDTMMLTEHLSSKQHQINLQKIKNDKDCEIKIKKDITLENVKEHLYRLRDLKEKDNNGGVGG
ncbi:U4/U6.U5 snRNP associated protein [Pichia californica]|uniref:U4/U6.U5 snRNP associated protein n=1 Tax=Pichia californica TaxID=460514 RepID=A0A9P7BG02_9ASCO|nr:U4/U6.U5 snRNP associated protein [[Candida] californica]KAG0688189.1 U4/U6.U5 snRNP associated protein [[Candida] californica]